jgi:hypothetical protein
MATGRSTLLAGAALAAATLCPAAPADKVQGTVTVGPKKVTLSTGMAVVYGPPSDQRLSVFLSDKPVDLKEFAENTRIGAGEQLTPGLFDGAWAAQHLAGKLSGFSFTIGPNGLMLEQFVLGGRNNLFGIGNDNYVLDVKSKSPRLVGTIKTKSVIDVYGGAAMEASFDLAVTAR